MVFAAINDSTFSIMIVSQVTTGASMVVPPQGSDLGDFIQMAQRKQTRRRYPDGPCLPGWRSAGLLFSLAAIARLLLSRSRALGGNL